MDIASTAYCFVYIYHGVVLFLLIGSSFGAERYIPIIVLIIMAPERTSIMVKNLAAVVAGAISPYPTVQIEMQL
jgi:hypothetical protein